MNTSSPTPESPRNPWEDEDMPRWAKVIMIVLSLILGTIWSTAKSLWIAFVPMIFYMVYAYFGVGHMLYYLDLWYLQPMGMPLFQPALFAAILVVGETLMAVLTLKKAPDIKDRPAWVKSRIDWNTTRLIVCWIAIWFMDIIHFERIPFLYILMGIHK